MSVFTRNFISTSTTAAISAGVFGNKQVSTYRLIDLLSAELDTLVNRHPQIYPENTLRKNMYQLAVDMATFQNPNMDEAIAQFRLALHGSALQFGLTHHWIFDEYGDFPYFLRIPTKRP